MKRVKGIGGFSHEPHYEGETNDWITPQTVRLLRKGVLCPMMNGHSKIVFKMVAFQLASQLKHCTAKVIGRNILMKNQKFANVRSVKQGGLISYQTALIVRIAAYANR